MSKFLDIIRSIFTSCAVEDGNSSDSGISQHPTTTNHHLPSSPPPHKEPIITQLVFPISSVVLYPSNYVTYINGEDWSTSLIGHQN